MIINKRDNTYIVHIFNNFLNNINIFDVEEMISLLKNILLKIKDKYGLRGLCNVVAYYDNNYGIIIEIDNYYLEEVVVDVKIKFYLDAIFMMEIDWNIEDDNFSDIYYYDGKFYTYYNLFNDSKVIYKNSMDIIDDGLKIR